MRKLIINVTSPKLFYMVNGVAIKILAAFFMESNKPIENLHEMQKT